MTVERVAGYKTIEWAIDERGVATITLNRQKVYNAFDESMIAELTECVDAFPRMQT